MQSTHTLAVEGIMRLIHAADNLTTSLKAMMGTFS